MRLQLHQQLPHPCYLGGQLPYCMLCWAKPGDMCNVLSGEDAAEFFQQYSRLVDR